jgi:hypothetical protein
LIIEMMIELTESGLDHNDTMMRELTEAELGVVAGEVLQFTFNSNNSFTGQGTVNFTHKVTVTDHSFTEINNSSGTLVASGTGGTV